MSTINDHLIKDYYKVYSEPHRRYPTTFKWPGLIYHIALYVNSEKSISNKLNNNNKQRIDGNITSEPEEADNSVFESVVEHLRDNFYWRRPFKFESESKAPQSHEIVKFETEPANYLITRTSNFKPTFLTRFKLRDRTVPVTVEAVTKTGIDGTVVEPEEVNINTSMVVRCESHRNYFHLVFFLPLSLNCTGNEKNFTSLNWSAKANQSTSISKALYEGIQEISENYSPMKNLLKCVFDDPSTNKSVFLNFRGIVIPAQWLNGTTGSERFANEMFPSSHKGTKLNENHQKNAASFLDAVYEDVRAGVLNYNAVDAIANYARYGHLIYLSNLGSQRPEGQEEPLQFSLFYNGDARASNAEIMSRNWWLSRAVGRFLTAGTNRLLGLRRLTKLEEARKSLAEIEIEAAEVAATRVGGTRFADFESKLNALNDLMSKLNNILKPIGTKGSNLKAADSFLNVIAKNRLAYEVMRRSIDDLYIDRIAGWQSYNDFIHRRLQGTYSWIVDLEARYKFLFSFLDAQFESVKASISLEEQKRSKQLQKLGTVIAAVGIPAILTDQLGLSALSYLEKYCTKLFPLGKFDQDRMWYGICSIIPSEADHLAMKWILFLFWFFVIFPFFLPSIFGYNTKQDRN